MKVMQYKFSELIKLILTAEAHVPVFFLPTHPNTHLSISKLPINGLYHTVCFIGSALNGLLGVFSN